MIYCEIHPKRVWVVSWPPMDSGAPGMDVWRRDVIPEGLLDHLWHVSRTLFGGEERMNR